MIGHQKAFNSADEETARILRIMTIPKIILQMTTSPDRSRRQFRVTRASLAFFLDDTDLTDRS
jgi:hypothetical protein